MRVFIHYAPKHKQDFFEGTRLRKTIKGACELVDIEWVDFPSLSADVAHFISPFDYPLLIQKKNEGTPCVVSCGYAESEPRASFFEEYIDGSLRLKFKAKKILVASDVVLVPSVATKEILKKSGINTRIEIVEPAVNLKRFALDSVDNEIFPRYFRIHDGTKTIVATGSYYDKKSVNLLKELAIMCPEIEFYFFGSSSNADPFNLIKAARAIGKSSNLHFCSLVQDDIYRSAMISSIAYIESRSSKMDSIALLEAFASRCQVVGIGPVKNNPLLIDGETCRLFKNAKELASYLASLYENKAKLTIMGAYDVAKGRSLLNLGKDLHSIYSSLINSETKEKSYD